MLPTAFLLQNVVDPHALQVEHYTGQAGALDLWNHVFFHGIIIKSPGMRQWAERVEGPMETKPMRRLGEGLIDVQVHWMLYDGYGHLFKHYLYHYRTSLSPSSPFPA